MTENEWQFLYAGLGPPALIAASVWAYTRWTDRRYRREDEARRESDKRSAQAHGFKRRLAEHRRRLNGG